MNAVTTLERRSITADMAERYGMDPGAFEQTLRATVVPKSATREEFAAFLMVAKEFGLNPVTREIYAFPKKGGGIQPIIGVDGWANIINSHPAFDGMDFEDHHDTEGNVAAITCRVYRKDRAHAVTATEYLAECKRGTEPWQNWPRRMLRHKAMIQAARYAFGFAGVVDPDEAERFTITPAAPSAPPRNVPRLAPPEPEPDFPALVAQFEEDAKIAQSLQDLEDCAGQIPGVDTLPNGLRVRFQNAWEDATKRIEAEEGKKAEPKPNKATDDDGEAYTAPEIDKESPAYKRGVSDFQNGVTKLLNAGIKGDPVKLANWVAGQRDAQAARQAAA